MGNTWSRSVALLGAVLGLGLTLRVLLKRLRMADLHGQVVLITGGSRGLGLEMAREFARQGARLVICARTKEPLEQARQELTALGAEVLALPCDVGDQEQVQRMISEALARFGRIDILVNNAGIITVGPEQTMRLSDYEAAMKTMFWGSLYTTLAVLPRMRAERRGHIVNITSIGGKVSVPHLLPYACAKFASVGLSEGLHAELADDGVHVLTVVPGLMRTGSHVNALFKGEHTAEYTWFGVSATTPLTAISAQRAARQIVRATRRGDDEIILTLQAQLLSRFHGLLPGLTTGILAVVNRFLPGARATQDRPVSGRESRSKLSSTLTSPGEAAAHRYNQYAGQ